MRVYISVWPEGLAWFFPEVAATSYFTQQLVYLALDSTIVFLLNFMLQEGH